MTYLFIGINPRYQWFSWLPDRLNVMYSAAGFWDNDQGELRTRNYFTGGMRWLDCGGFTLLNTYGDYPFSMGAYANMVARLRPHYYATMDYPCEPEITRSLGLSDNATRIEATVENARRMLVDYEPMLPLATAVPVIQGWTLDEYIHCLDLHIATGTARPYMAVGSMCTRANDAELLGIVPKLHAYAAAAGVQRLHFFGLKMSPVTAQLEPYIWSRDSAAVLFANDQETKARWGGRWPRKKAHRREAFSLFFERAWAQELVYDLGHDDMCPVCHSYQINHPCEEFPEFACANCGHEWGEGELCFTC